eukprot:scaffold246100_cov18-Tisochrysis_lutea.AAC.1
MGQWTGCASSRPPRLAWGTWRRTAALPSSHFTEACKGHSWASYALPHSTSIKACNGHLEAVMRTTSVTYTSPTWEHTMMSYHMISRLNMTRHLRAGACLQAPADARKNLLYVRCGAQKVKEGHYYGQLGEEWQNGRFPTIAIFCHVYPKVSSNGITETVAKEMGSVGGLAGP